MWMFSVGCFSVTFVMCLWGTYADAYDDNWGQRLGMAVVGIGCASRISSIWELKDVNPEWLILHSGLAIFSISTGIKVYARWKRKHNEPLMLSAHNHLDSIA